MLNIACNKVCILLAHLDLIEDNIIGVGEHFIFHFGPFHIQTIVLNHLQGVFDVQWMQVKLSSGLKPPDTLGGYRH